MGIDLDGEVLGAPAYHPRLLLSVWLYGFMSGTRSSRKLERACREQIPFLWLTGRQYPDHNTLWRFYQAHRQAMRNLLKYTVATAMEVGLVDLAVQAVDGTKVAANAAGDQTYDATGLQRLLDRTEVAIAELEAQNETDDTPSPPRLPSELQHFQTLREKVRAALDQLAENKQKQVNLTDREAHLMKGRQGGVQLPEPVREVLEEFQHHEEEKRSNRHTARLIVQAVVAGILVIALAMHLAAVGLVGLMVIVLLTAFNGIIEEHQIGHAFEEALPFTALLVVFFSIVAVIHDQHLFSPVIDYVLAMEGDTRIAAFFLANGVLSMISDNVFVAAAATH